MPELRFPECRGNEDWKEKPLESVCKTFSGGTPTTTKKEFYGGNIPFIRSAEIGSENTRLFLTQKGLESSSAKLIQKGDVLFALYGANSGEVALAKLDGAINQAILCLKSKSSNTFIYQSLLYRQKCIVNKYIQGGQGNLSGDIVKSIYIPMPKHDEQQKIADCLSSIDKLITAQIEKLATLKTHKKGLMQQLFPAEGKTLPKLRFSEFRDMGAWKQMALESHLDYIQPTKYLVSSTAYDERHETPVLTAGKTFILGYTNEIDGIYSKGLPVIIFDDFTTASKFVDFPFKAKSSAMKILFAKKHSNIKFIYESMQTIKYQVGVHERHWISIFSKLKIPVPQKLEQQKIADCLSSLDELITAQTQKIDALKAHKKGLMQKLFPSMDRVDI